MLLLMLSPLTESHDLDPYSLMLPVEGIQKALTNKISDLHSNFSKTS